MAAPTFVNVSQTITSGGADPSHTTSVALPSGWAAGDILLLCFASGACDTPEGYYAVRSSSANAGGGSTSNFLFWKRAEVGETDPVIVTRGATNERMASMIAIRGAVHSGEPFDDIVAGSGSGTAVTMTGVTTTVADCMVLHVLTTGADNITGQRMSALTNVNLTGLAERLDSWSATGGGVGTYMATGVKTGAGATGNTTATNTAADAWAYWSVSIKPDGSGGLNHFNGPTFVAAGTSAVTGVAATITPGLPTGTQANDVLFMIVARRGGNAPSAPSGYAHVTGSPSGELSVFWKRASVGEAAVGITYSGATLQFLLAQVVAYRGCATVGDPWNAISAFTTDSGNDTTRNAPGLTTTTDMCRVVHIVNDGVDNITGQRVTDPRNTDLFRLREDTDNWTSTGSGGGFAAFGGNLPTAGTIGVGGVTSLVAATSLGVTLALAKDVGAETGGQMFQAQWVG